MPLAYDTTSSFCIRKSLLNPSASLADSYVSTDRYPFIATRKPIIAKLHSCPVVSPWAYCSWFRSATALDEV